MTITTIAQLASSVTNMISVIVIALGYYFIGRVSKQTLDGIKRSARLAADARW